MTFSNIIVMDNKETQLQALFAAAYKSHEKGLRTHAFFRVHDKATSEDLVQDTFVKTWSYLVKKGEIVMMKAFLYHILNDLVVDEYRKHKTTSLDTLMETGFEPRVDDTKRLLNILDGKEALLLIQLLPETYKKVLHMRYVQDLSLKEISLITKQTKNTVAVQAHRGLEKLRVLYNAQKSPPTRKNGKET